VLVNAEFHRQFGYSDDDVIGHSTQIIYTSEEAYQQQGKIRYQANSESIPAIYEIEYKRKDGSVFPSETMGAPIKLPTGEHIGFVAIIRDISQRRQTEEENRRLLRELQQAQKMESIGHLTGGIAHDFNNILASIVGYTDLALSISAKQQDNKLQRYLSHIKTSGERASNLIKQMLAFSRNTPSEPEALNIADILDETVNILQPTLPASIKLEIQLTTDTPPVMMDKTQLQQVIINICVNARDAMAAEGRLIIRLQYRNNISLNCNSCHAGISGDYVDLSISDTGTGMDNTLLNHIFDPFFTTKEVGKGTGMGLSVVHGILHQHRAHLHIETHVDVGTTFHLLFPAADMATSLAAARKRDIQSINPAFGTGKHVLVVDDEELILHYLKSLLEMYGFQITITASSVEALELLKNNSKNYDLLITDQTMPNITGLGLIKELHNIQVNIPVILCSGYSEKINANNARELGVMAFINKPLSQSDLLDCLQRLL
jgi:PAS domain S-box-containing protein